MTSLTMRYVSLYKSSWILHALVAGGCLIWLPMYRSANVVETAILRLLLLFIGAGIASILSQNSCAWSKIEVSAGSLKETVLGGTTEIRLDEEVDVAFIRIWAVNSKLPMASSGFDRINQLICAGWIAEIRQHGRRIKINPAALTPRLTPEEVPEVLCRIYKAYLHAGWM